MRTLHLRAPAKGAWAALLVALVLPVPTLAATPAPAAGPPVRAAQAAEDGLDSSIADRGRAAAVVGVVAPPDWMVLNDRDFVFKLWQSAGDLAEVRGSAELALINSTSTSYLECTVFIESGIHDAKARDVADVVRDSAAARAAREAKQKALITVGIAVTPELLLLSDRDFVYAIYRQATGTLVKAGALAAFDGTAQQQHDFIATGILAAREQDRRNEIAADEQRTEAERRALLERDARIRAAAVLAVIADEGLLVRSDENFVRWVWNTAKDTTEVYAAAMSALRSADPATWRAFIHTGIHEADRRDIAAELRARAEQHRREVRQILADAQRDGKRNLARAATAALAGTDDEVATFLRVGRHQVPPDNDCANPVLQDDADQWGPLDGVVVARQPVVDHPSARFELTVANGAAPTARIYLPRQSVQGGAMWQFAADARTAGDPAKMRMEADWYTANGGYLGRTNSAWQPVSGQRAYTRISGRFTTPAGAARANVLLAATDLAANGGFASTLCAYDPVADPDVKLTVRPGTGSATATWTTTRTDITGWTIGRDGEDSRQHGPWETERPADARSQQFNLLVNEKKYSFVLVPRTAAGPLTPVVVGAMPSTQAAVAHDWGTPIAAYSDEFDYTGPPAASKWGQADECWDNPHADGDSKRCASRTTVDGSKLVMTGLANGNTGWLGHKWSTRYGRWEARVRSSNTAPGNRRTFRPLLIVWPDNDIWPEEGEYDFLENMAPGQPCAQAFMHYPHADGIPIQQEHYVETDCGAPLSEWHHIAFEWTPDYVRGLVDGREWFRKSGGANAQRRAMQSMASGHLTMQLDNFDGPNMTPAKFEADWIRVYAL